MVKKNYSVKYMENKLNIKRKKCKITKMVIEQIYSDQFNVFNIYGKWCFDDVCQKACLNLTENLTLVEQMLKRNFVISQKANEFTNNSAIFALALDYLSLFKIISSELIPMEIFYAMEYEMRTNNNFGNNFYKVYEHFKKIAEFYLDYTSPLYKYLCNSNEKNIKRMIKK